MNTIERRLILNASLDRAWHAIGTPEGYSAWFKSSVTGDWRVGQDVLLQWPSGSTVEIRIVAIDAPHHFAYQWHPGEDGTRADFPIDQLTTVSFRLREVEGGTELHLLESGFEAISEDRKLKALGMNTEGWDEELGNIKAYVEA